MYPLITTDWRRARAPPETQEAGNVRTDIIYEALRKNPAKRDMVVDVERRAWSHLGAHSEMTEF